MAHEAAASQEHAAHPRRSALLGSFAWLARLADDERPVRRPAMMLLVWIGGAVAFLAFIGVGLALKELQRLEPDALGRPASQKLLRAARLLLALMLVGGIISLASALAINR